MCVDGNYAVAHVSYRVNDTAVRFRQKAKGGVTHMTGSHAFLSPSSQIIFPITPSSPMVREGRVGPIICCFPS